MMNDTFDNLTLSNLTTTVEVSTKNDKQDLKTNENDISFDDSLFLNSQEFSVWRKIENPLIKSENTTETDNTNTSQKCSENDSLIDDIFQSSTFSTSTDIFIEPDVKNEALKLSSWGLPDAILEKYASRNITTMFPWQVECLNNPRVLKENANLVYSAPTSAGKTLVSEILAIKTVLERSKKVIFILPFVSVVREKMFYFQDIFGGSGVRVEGFMGGYNPPGGFKGVQFAVCTIEKANSLINHCLQEGTLGKIGAVIIDEMHLLGEPNRGYILELLLTKLKYMNAKSKDVEVQIVGMSATLPNLATLSRWLEAELYVTNFRPIPLYEQASCGGAIYDTDWKLVRRIEPLPGLDTDTDNILQLCLETITLGCSVLIFCPTKNWCENLAQQISSAFWKLGTSQSESGKELRNQLKTELICEVLEQLKRCPVGLDEVLRKTVSFGVAFHHAGLTLDERDIIEGSFRNGTVRVLVATSTLSSGVNLPARRVIIRTPLFHGKPIDALTYRQMIGRAGRMGKDTSGESILVCQKNDEKTARNLMSLQLKPIESCLEGDGKLKRALLEVVASGVAETPDDLQLFTKCTLLAQTNEGSPIDSALKFLTTHEFVRLVENKYVATPLGKACLASSIPPEDGLSLFTELGKARQCFVLETELHLIYLVTPYSACHQWGNIDWMFYLDMWEKLPTSMKKVGELVGVREGYIVSATRGKLQTNTTKLYHQLLVHKRFFVALALQDLVNEKPLSEVCAKFSCNRGMLQTLQLTASTFAGMVTSFSKQLGWSSVEILISQFQDRLHFGVSRDLLDLMKLPILNGKCARALFNGGLETLVHIANSDVDTIEGIFHKVMPFESEKLQDGETEFDLKERKRLKNIWITGKEGLTEREAAELVLVSARNYLKIEMGLAEAKWERNDAARTQNTQTPLRLTTSSGENTPSKYKSQTSDDSLFENSILEDTPSKQISRISLNSSGDFVTTSQDESFVSFRGPTPAKKRSRGKENKFVRPEESPRKKPKRGEAIEIIDVCDNDNLLSSFRNEVRLQKDIAFSVVCSKTQEKKRAIGLSPPVNSELSSTFSYKNTRVEGFGICWDGRTSYYISLAKASGSIRTIEDLVSNQELTVTMFDAKEQMKVLKRCCGVDLKAKIEDPKIADWLLEPEGREKSFHLMVQVYTPTLATMSRQCGITKSRGSPSVDPSNTADPKIKGCVEAVLTWHLGKNLKELLSRDASFLTAYATETSCLRILAQMELVGLPTSKPHLLNLLDTLTHHLQNLEKEIFSLAGRRFSLSSSKDVAKILNITKARKVSTKKQVLEKSDNPIAPLILQWRKLSCTITKTIHPLIQSVENNRIHGSCVVHTATGRISMHEPNLQNIAKNFEVAGVEISCRSAFRAEKVFVSADYCQLELRLLTHLSQDEVLCRIMKTKEDVFKSVAAKWNNISEEEVTDDLRQRAKKICYGIIYGMGAKTLAEQLLIDEEQAAAFMETFRSAYPGVKKYIREVVENCKKNGYVETVSGRRRYLPHINHKNPVIRSQAERQAINTTIQGSAADIVKKTMIKLDQKCSEMELKADLVLHLHDELLYEVEFRSYKLFAGLLKQTMEESVELSIPFPVKVKTGSSWGQLTEYKL